MRQLTHRQHVQAQVAVLQFAQQLVRQLLLKLAQRVLLRPQAQLEGLRVGKEGGRREQRGARVRSRTAAPMQTIAAGNRCNAVDTNRQPCSRAIAPNPLSLPTLLMVRQSSAADDQLRRRQISKRAREMRGALLETYIRSAVRLKLSTRARLMYACSTAGA